MRKHLLLIFLFVSCVSFAEIYKWTDENGRVHFSDTADKTQQVETITVQINSYQNVSVGAMAQDAGKTVKLFSTQWCGFCKKAKRYFIAKGIPFVELDIEKSAAAKREFDAIGGKGVPVILVGKKRMNGFNQQGFDAMYNNL